MSFQNDFLNCILLSFMGKSSELDVDLIA